jgi:hypothetical protein
LAKSFFSKTVKTLLLVIIAAFSINVFGQKHYPPCAAFDSTGKDTIRVVNSYSNSLYAGIDNEVEISKKYVPYKNIIVECSRGIAMEDSPYYLIVPAKPGYTTITIYQYDKGDTVLYFQKKLQVKSVPPPYIAFQSARLLDYKYLDKGDLLKFRRFEVHLSDDFIDDSQWYTIKEISMGYAIGKLYILKSCEGPKLSNEIIKLIQQIPPGTEVAFTFSISGDGDFFKRLAPVRIKMY